jgi:hypothetical protein
MGPAQFPWVRFNWVGAARGNPFCGAVPGGLVRVPPAGRVRGGGAVGQRANREA